MERKLTYQIRRLLLQCDTMFAKVHDGQQRRRRLFVRSPTFQATLSVHFWIPPNQEQNLIVRLDNMDTLCHGHSRTWYHSPPSNHDPALSRIDNDRRTRVALNLHRYNPHISD
ncbi:hypothetical protein PV11_05740 [Exophiala sideris]|uniref:Uncharacterized protein n=1 Tax=Exophiala sideris TaxID=1016849 RepID=A0A0D1YQT8_9EURO|nr:hypothetical protein PV11_05740 [Exophiala sideris]